MATMGTVKFTIYSNICYGKRSHCNYCRIVTVAKVIVSKASVVTVTVAIIIVPIAIVDIETVARKEHRKFCYSSIAEVQFCGKIQQHEDS